MLNQWAARWGVPPEALADLRAGMVAGHASGLPVGASEAAAQQRTRLDASRSGVRLWRNNVGVLEDDRGVPIRFGLANDSKELNKVLKSSDLIGITPYTVQPHDVGRVLGVFTSVEVKRPGWRYTGNGREAAQLSWIELVVALGGFGYFST